MGKRRLPLETMVWLEHTRGHIIFWASIALGISIIFSGVTGRLTPVHSWKLVLQVFGNPTVSLWIWGAIYIGAGVMGVFSMLVPHEYTRKYETGSAALIGVASFVISVFLVMAWIDNTSVPVWVVLFFYLCANGTVRAIAHLKRLS